MSELDLVTKTYPLHDAPPCGIGQSVPDLCFGGANCFFHSCQVHTVEHPFSMGSHGLSVTLSPGCLFSSELPDCPCALGEPSASPALLPSQPYLTLLITFSQHSSASPLYLV